MQDIKSSISSVKLWAGIIALSLLALFVFASRAIANDDTVNADARMVSIYDRGVEQTIITKAKTVRGALEQANIDVASVDIVEPGLSEPLLDKQYNINVYRARPVIVQDGNTEVKTVTAAQTATDIAKSAATTIYPEDKTELKRVDGMLENGGAGLRLAIDRATVFTLVQYGKRIDTARTQATTVGGMLKEKGIVLGAQDGVSVPPETPLTAGMTVSVWRNGKQTITQEEAIAKPIEEIKDANRERGFREVKTPGQDGKKNATYEIEMRDGVEVARKEIVSVTTKEPVKEVVVVGTKLPPVAGPEEIVSKIRAAANAKGIDAERVLTIARCESKFNPMADSGYYKGIFQHDPGYWPARAAKYGFAGASIFDVDAQIGVSTSMMAGGGWSHWGCDPY